MFSYDHTCEHFGISMGFMTHCYYIKPQKSIFIDQTHYRQNNNISKCPILYNMFLPVDLSASWNYEL